MSSPEESLERLIQKNIEKIYTSVPGTFVAINKETLTGDVKMSVPMKSGVTGQTDPIVTILDVPIAFPSGAKYSVTYPITKGDQCLLVFSQSELGEWKSSMSLLNQTSGNRRYHISSAIAIPSLTPPIQAKTKHSSTDGFDLNSVNFKGNVKISENENLGTDITATPTGNVDISGKIRVGKPSTMYPLTEVALADATYTALDLIMKYLNEMVFFPPIIPANKAALLKCVPLVYRAMTQIKSSSMLATAASTGSNPMLPFAVTTPSSSEIKQLFTKYNKAME